MNNKKYFLNFYKYHTNFLGLHLVLPSITFNRPSSPTASWGPQSSGQGGYYGSSYQLQSGARGKTLMMTQRGSFLAINQNSQECRESMLSINYPGYSGLLLLY